MASHHGGKTHATAKYVARRKSAIVLGMNYGPDHNPMDNLLARTAGNISVYARGRDYHDVLKGKLKQLAGQFSAKTGNAVKVFVDTAPLMEKPLPSGGPWVAGQTYKSRLKTGRILVFLGIILTNANLPHDVPRRIIVGLSSMS